MEARCAARPDWATVPVKISVAMAGCFGGSIAEFARETPSIETQTTSARLDKRGSSKGVHESSFPADRLRLGDPHSAVALRRQSPTGKKAAPQASIRSSTSCGAGSMQHRDSLATKPLGIVDPQGHRGVALEIGPKILRKRLFPAQFNKQLLAQLSFRDGAPRSPGAVRAPRRVRSWDQCHPFDRFRHSESAATKR